MSYYRDDDKLTFDDAEQRVVEFIEQAPETQTTVTCQEVAEGMEIDDCHHNLIRLDDALSRMLDVHRESGSRSTRYEL